jgi:hypothetical protein
MEFNDVIKLCTINQALFPRTAQDYCIGGLVVFQFVKSTKNVWIDYVFLDKIKDQAKFESDLRAYFGKVKTVYFGLDINGHNQEMKNKFKEILEKFGGLNY